MRLNPPGNHAIILILIKELIPMLTKEDLQAITAILKEEISTAIVASEERTNKKIDTMYVSLKEDMETVRREIKVDIENGVEKNVRAVLDGHAALKEKLDDIIDRVETAENIEPRVVALEVKVKENSADITNLKKAQ